MPDSRFNSSLPLTEQETRLAQAEVALWLLPVDSVPEPAVAQLSKSLSAEEQERNLQYSRPVLRRRDAACRGLLRELLSRYLQVPAAAVPLVRGEHGKPLLAGPEVSIHFNYSHSGDYAAFAFTRAGEVGVDIEDCTRRANALGISRNFFTDREYRALQALPESQRVPEFLRYWTLKEAWLKARGEGIFAGLDRFSITLPDADEGDASVELGDHAAAREAPVYCHSRVAVPGYRLGLVVRGVTGPLAITQREVRFDEVANRVNGE